MAHFCISVVSLQVEVIGWRKRHKLRADQVGGKEERNVTMTSLNYHSVFMLKSFMSTFTVHTKHGAHEHTVSRGKFYGSFMSL